MKKLILSLAVMASCSMGFSQAVGDIIITEFLPDPSGDENLQEWFEVYNTTGTDIDIEGWTIKDDGASNRYHLIANGGSGVVVPANGYAVLSESADMSLNGGISVVYGYGYPSQSSETSTTVGSGSGNGFPKFNNSNSFDDDPATCGSDAEGISDNEVDGIALIIGGVVIDEVLYDYGYSNAPIGFPDISQLVGYDSSQLSCSDDNKGLDDNVSIQFVGSLTSAGESENDVAANWAFSNGMDVIGSFSGTPGSGPSNTLYINDLSLLDGAFTISPNPVNDIINISISNNVTLKEMRLINMNGQVVKSKKSDLLNMNVSDVAPGMYVLQIESAKAIDATVLVLR